MRMLLLLMAALFLSSCDWSSSAKPSIVVIAVEGLDFDSVSCLENELRLTGGFFEMCRDSVRFTHAYTPSVMSQAALASILSARFPVEHGVRHNGEQYLTEEIETVSEVAVRRNFRTGFFSGGAPVWRKSGLSQGFELFDDHVPVTLGRYYRTAVEVFGAFDRWLETEVEESNFFSVLYLNDLQFYNTPIRDEEGLEKSLTRESQLVAIDVALSQFIENMKKRRLWHSSHVFLMGLNGRNGANRLGEIRGTNLHSDNTQVVLMIKPSRKERDSGLEWAITSNVSLVDVGATLFSLVGAGDFSFFERAFEVASLTTSMERPVANWNKNRWILTESAWPTWRQVSGVRTALRRGRWLYFYDPNSRLFNTLVDSKEVNPIADFGALEKNEVSQMQEFLQSRDAQVWQTLPEDLVQKLQLGRSWSKDEKLNKSEILSLKHLIRKRPWDLQMVGWLVRQSLAKSDWKELESLAKDYIGDSWTYLAAKLQGKEPRIPSDPCIGILIKKSVETQAKGDTCADDILVSFIEWVESSGTSKEALRSKQFLRGYYHRKLDDEIAAFNYMNGLFWDVALTEPGLPPITDLVMELPEFRKYKNVARQSLKSLTVDNAL